MSDEDVVLLRETLPGVTDECVEIVRYGGVEAFPREPGRCFEMEEPQVWTGYWVHGLEYSVFCGPEGMACFPEEADRWTDTVWLSFATDTELPSELPRYGDGGEFHLMQYRIEFVGRITTVRGCHGHECMSEREIVVDDLISVEFIDPDQ